MDAPLSYDAVSPQVTIGRSDDRPVQKRSAQAISQIARFMTVVSRDAVAVTNTSNDRDRFDIVDMELETLYDLYLHELKDLYSAEQQLIKALPKMSKAATNRQLVAGFNEHLQQTKEHALRLEEIFKRLEESPRGPKCEGMEGLIAEGDKMAKEDAEDEVRDAGLIAAAQRVEHYEIAGYGCARTYAELLGDKTGARLLNMTLKEEGETDKKLTKLAKSAINLNAVYVPRAGRKNESSLTAKAKEMLARLTS
jgi:ferritin-like metal-binding protein YciE